MLMLILFIFEIFCSLFGFGCEDSDLDTLYHYYNIDQETCFNDYQGMWHRFDEYCITKFQIHSNDRGIFYKHTNGIGIISSDPSKHYDEVSLLIPIESDDTCTFKKQFGYTWCADYFGEDEIIPNSVDICVETNFDGIKTTDGYCLEILVIDYVDEFNRAFKEQKLHFIDWKIFEEKQSIDEVKH